MPHPKGLPKTPGSGRKVGSRNKATAGIRELARAFVDDPTYRETLKQRLLAGEAGQMETLLWAYGYGRPPLSSEDGAPLPVSITITF